MTFTMLFRDEQGREVKVADLVVSDILHSTVFLCPKEGRMANIEAEIIQGAFEKAGVYAIICKEPVQLYQVQQRETT